MIGSVIFDFDGVLVESVDVKTHAFAELCRPHGKDAVAELVAYHLANGGVSRFEKFRYLYRDILRKPLSDSELSDLAGRFADLVIDKVVRAPFVTGALSFLERYAKEIDLYVVSGIPETELMEIIERRKMAKYFQSVHGSPGPKIEPTKRIVAAVGDPDRVVFIGDAMCDLEAAQGAGIKFIGRADPRNEISCVFSGLSIPLVKDLTELPELIGLKP